MQGEHSDGNGQEPRKNLDEFRRYLDNVSPEARREALDRLNAEVAANPDDAYGLFARGFLHMEAGDDRRAEEDFSRVVELIPEDAEAHHYSGLALAQLGKHSEAIAAFDAAIRLDPDDAVSLYNRGISAAELGDLEQVGDARLLQHLLPGLVGGVAQAEQLLAQAEAAAAAPGGAGHRVPAHKRPPEIDRLAVVQQVGDLGNGQFRLGEVLPGQQVPDFLEGRPETGGFGFQAAAQGASGAPAAQLQRRVGAWRCSAIADSSFLRASLPSR